MPLGHVGIQWSNFNSQRAYPLTSWSTRRDSTDTITIPDNFIVSLQFPVHAGHDVEAHLFFIKSLVIYPTGYNIEIGYHTDTQDLTVGVVNIPAATHVEDRTYAVAGVDSFDDTVGSIAIGVLTDINQLPPGQYTFNYAATGIEPDCIRPMIRGITSLAVVSASGETSERLYGDIELVAGSNMRIDVSQVAGMPTQLIFHAIEGTGFNEECVCEEITASQGIMTINGICPTPDGNFRIIGDNCITVEPIDHGVQLIDACSEPCCGCDELDALITQIDRFADGATTLRNFVERLSTEVEEMSQVVIGSRLGDQGCVEC